MVRKYSNPIIRGFHPDPSICRVGGDYYLVTSSFEYFPGIPIYHSTDLVNWEQIGNCITRTSQLSFADAGNSGGIWAPTIRYDDSVFYVTATVSGKGNLIISTHDITGPWSDPVWVDMGGIDPSLYFEAGKAYYCTNAREHPDIEEISLAEIDINTGLLKSRLKAIWTGTGGGFLEAPHLYQINDWYYLLAAEGGTYTSHTATIARSKNIWGPYESCPYNPILTNRNDTTKQVQCAGHGDLFVDHNANWWLVHLGTRTSQHRMTNLGRETFLSPIVWKDGWPIVDSKQAKLVSEGPLGAEQKRVPDFQCNFHNSHWESQWLFLRNPIWDNYQRGNGKLALHPAVGNFTNSPNPTFATIRQMDFDCQVETEFVFDPEEVGDEAGVVIYLQSDFNYRICKRKETDGYYIIVEKQAEDFHQIAYQAAITAGKVRLKIVADKRDYHFYYAVDEQDWVYVCKASTRFLSTEVVTKCFTGTTIGVYALCEKETTAVATFSSFSMNQIDR